MKYIERFLPAVLFLSLLVIYGLTLAPGLTWANHGADGGDLITAAATGGIPHPTGYPVYTLLARTFQFLPIGSLAFRTNLLSALAAAGASLLVYGLVTRASQNHPAGLIAAYAFGLSPLLWSQAVITEVYTLHAFFVALILYLSIFPPFSNERKSDLALGLTLGLALGNHATAVFLLPVVLASTFWRADGRNRWDAPAASRRLAWMGVGLLSYLIIPLRALAHPPVNWGNPITLENFAWLVSAQKYQSEVFSLTLPSLGERIQSAAALLLAQFGIAGLILSLVGVVLYFRPSPLFRNSLWIMAAFSIFALGYATYDSFYNFIPAMMSFSIWIGLGVDGLMKTLSRRSRSLSLAAVLTILVYLFVIAGGHWRQVDASRDARAEQFGELIMKQMPADTLVFARGDRAIFSLWYFHFALGQRADLALISADLLRYDWYRETLEATYPSLVVPSLLPDSVISANPGRPVCIVEYDDQMNILCP